jgi:chromosome partitioning protein
MIVIAIGQCKGGVGKTTLAVNIAGEIARYGRSVTLIDVDPQGSATRWSEPQRLGFPVRKDLLALRKELVWIRDILKTDSDYVVLDLPSGLGPTFDTGILIADLLIVPSGPSSLDINAAGLTIKRARMARANEPVRVGLKIVTVPTRVDLGHEEGNQIREELQDLGEAVGPAISYDVDYVRCFTAGQSVSSFIPGGRASKEVTTLCLFLLRQVLPRRDPLFQEFAQPEPAMAAAWKAGA